MFLFTVIVYRMCSISMIGLYLTICVLGVFTHQSLIWMSVHTLAFCPVIQCFLPQSTGDVYLYLIHMIALFASGWNLLIGEIVIVNGN